jgi:hypothetical protein
VGGTTGQVLAKASATNYDTEWVARNPFDQDLNTTEGVTFGGLTVTDGNVGVTVGYDGINFSDTTFQTTALPSGTDDGNIVEWNADTNTYASVPNDARTLFITARNITGTTIPKGSVVLITGASGNRPTIGLAQGDTSANADGVIGITAAAINNNANGRVITEGLASNLDTSAFAAGDKLYLSSTTPGGLVNVRPVQPAHSVAVGVVTRSNPAVGSIEVRVQVGEHLEFLHDVLLTSNTNLDLLSYETSSGLWKNKSFSTLGLLTSATAASTYLTTSTAASTYSPIASPTFTGTVTIPAGASISGFALLASPVFTGVPEAPTAAATTNTTQVATTAFVQQEVPAASTTAAGKVELATDAEAVAGTSATLAVTPANLSASFQNCDYFEFQGNAWTASTSGVGASTVQILNGKGANAPTSAVGHAILYSGTYLINRGSSSNAPATWGKNYALSFRFTNGGGTIDSNSVGRILFGKGSATTTTGLAVRGFGVEFTVGGLLKILAHDGTTLTTTNTTHTVTSIVSQDVTLRLNSSGTVECFVNGTSVGTSTGGPTSGTNSVGNAVHVESENIDVLTNSRLALIVQNLRLTKDV